MDDSRLVKMRTYIEGPMKESEPTTAREYLHRLRMSEKNAHAHSLKKGAMTVDEIKNILSIEFPYKQIEVIDRFMRGYEIRVYDMYFNGQEWKTIMAGAIYDDLVREMESTKPLAREISYIKGYLESLKN